MNWHLCTCILFVACVLKVICVLRPMCHRAQVGVVCHPHKKIRFESHACFTKKMRQDNLLKLKISKLQPSSKS